MAQASSSAPGTILMALPVCTGIIEDLTATRRFWDLRRRRLEASRFHLCEGDILVVYSDGLTDAENPEGKMLGEKTLREVIQRSAPSGCKAVEAAIRKASTNSRRACRKPMTLL